MIDAATMEEARALIGRLRAAKVTVGTAESLTGGLIAATLTAVPGASEVVDRGVVVYSCEAKTALLGVPRALLDAEGAVSEAVARSMALGLLERAEGRVHLAVARRSDRAAMHAQRDYGDVGRAAVRLATVRDALAMLGAALDGA